MWPRNARADGHTFLFASLSLSTGPGAGQAWASIRCADLVPIAGIGAIPSLMVVSP